MEKENRYIESCYGTVVDQCPLMRAPDGFKMRVDKRDVPLYLTDGWQLVKKDEELTNVK